MHSTIFILLLLIILITGCDTGNSKQRSGGQYKHLVEKSADELSYDELYNRTLTLWEVPFEQRRLKTSAGEAHIIIAGPSQAPPLVLLHGMNASSTMWYPNIKALSKDYRVYAIDYIWDSGKSSPSQELNSVEQAVNWHFEVFDQLKLAKIILVGASQGGWLATQLVATDKSRFSHLALLSPAQTFTWISPSFDMFSNLLFMTSPNKKDLPDILSTMSNNLEKLDQLYIDQYFRAIKNASFPSLARHMQPFSDEEIAKINIPVLLLIGDKDIINDKDSIETANKHLPNVTTKIIKDAGHFLSVDQAKITNQKIINFINSH
ncbi:alpha/beta fold hydrolase [Paraglaciecola sp. L3A3]|uniref:alpha/beta fold hydrolase n=1 Tax=Paraglaciecola sp. L3A3 TaxID=2686358 RepID=UPI00131B2D48|nr:alpha/beta hydrolase [Paraglaciecola sp. L3A3]